MRYAHCLSIIVAGLLWFGSVSYAQTGPCPGGAPLAFEGAEGYGRCSQGGRGGQLIDVTTLADDRDNPPVGSLRACVEASGPRICNIKVTGWIAASGYDMTVRHPNLTLNCVANGHAIGLKEGGFYVRASHTIFRNCRILPGLYALAQLNMNANGIFFWSDEQGGRTHDHIIDHSVAGYTSDDTYGINAQKVTIQESISGPAMNCWHLPCGGKGIGMGASDLEVSVIRSLQVHTYIRFPEITSGKADFINSVSYNGHGTDAQINTVYGPIQVNFVGNVFLKGPNTYGHNPGDVPYNPYQSIRTKGGLPFSGTSTIHVKDNIGRCYQNGQFDVDHLCAPDTAIIWGDDGGIATSSTFLGPGLSLVNAPMPASQTLAYVLAHAGPFPRSAFENKIIEEVQNRTGIWPENEAAYGGWPVLTGGGDPTPPPPPNPPPPPPPTSDYTLSAPASTPGPSVVVNYTAPANHSEQDWITFAPVGSASDYYMEGWLYVPAGASGALTMTAPATEGNYELRYLLNNGFERAATIPIAVGTVAPPPPPPPAQCANGVDDDGDTLIDLADPGCIDAADNDEYNPPPPPVDKFSNVTNSGKVLTFQYVPAECPDGVSKLTGPVVNGKRTVTMTCKP